jgi:hypothetical protein
MQVETLYQLQEILASRLGGDREKIRAAQILASMSRIDVADDRLNLERSRQSPERPTDARDALLREAERIVDGSKRGEGDRGRGDPPADGATGDRALEGEGRV